MLYKKLGRSGLKVSGVSIGSWTTFGESVDDDATLAVMEAAYDAGINFFDGAEGYGRGAAEEAMGRVFEKVNWPRDTLVISTKVFGFGDAPTQAGLSRKHLVEAVDAALRRMHLDYVDMCFCHRPDPDTPLDEIAHTMNELIARGKIFYWGTSEFSPGDLHQLHAIAERDGLVGPTMEQTCHSMLHRRRVDGELRPLFDAYGLGTTIYSPLCQGVLTGKYNEGFPKDSRFGRRDAESRKNAISNEDLARVRRLTMLAGDLGMTMTHLALAWCLKNPNVSTAITGSTRPEQVHENVKAADAVEKLTDEVMGRIEEILDNAPE
ncbi:MAG: aldo/keto reductase [Planctomycetaceae bacterium]|nr:aldo/keto reductase [Planctomycetaceae bacterium]